MALRLALRLTLATMIIAVAATPASARTPLIDDDTARRIMQALRFTSAAAEGMFERDNVEVAALGRPDIWSRVRITVHPAPDDGQGLLGLVLMRILVLAFAGEQGAALVDENLANADPGTSVAKTFDGRELIIADEADGGISVSVASTSQFQPRPPALGLGELGAFTAALGLVRETGDDIPSDRWTGIVGRTGMTFTFRKGVVIRTTLLTALDDQALLPAAHWMSRFGGPEGLLTWLEAWGPDRVPDGQEQVLHLDDVELSSRLFAMDTGSILFGAAANLGGYAGPDTSPAMLELKDELVFGGDPLLGSGKGWWETDHFVAPKGTYRVTWTAFGGPDGCEGEIALQGRDYVYLDLWLTLSGRPDIDGGSKRVRLHSGEHWFGVRSNCEWQVSIKVTPAKR